MPTTASPRPRYTSRSFKTILAELIAYVAETRSDLQTYLTEASLGQMLLELNAFAGDIASYSIDAAALECFLITAKRYDTALRFCRSVGYSPVAAASAIVTLESGTLHADLTANGGSIPAGTIITGAGNVVYELIDAATINIADTTVTFTMTEGVSRTVEFDTTNQPRQQVRVPTGVVADASWSVYVGVVGPGNLWVQVDNVATELGVTDAYEVSFDGDGRLIVQFGDGIAGAIPDDDITIQYRTCQGAAGNTPIEGVNGSVKAAVAVLGYDVVIPVTNASAAATGGLDRESLTSLKVNVPAYLRTNARIVSIRDYDQAALNVTGVNAAYADLWFASYNANGMKVNIWGSETVPFVSESAVPTRQSSVSYTRSLQAVALLETNVKAYLEARTNLGTFTEIVRPGVAWLDFYLGDITYDDNFDADVVHAAITEAVVGVFEDANGLSIRLVDVYDAIRAVDGVLYFDIQRVVYEHASKTRATGTVVFNLLPADTNTITINDGDQTLTFELDDTGAITGGNIAVALDASSHDTMSNLVAAINANFTNIIASKTAAALPTCDLQQLIGGVAYNLPVTKTGVNIAVTGMVGGLETVSDIYEDMRRIQINPGSATDAWPPGPNYVPGTPFTGVVAWQDDGIQPYLPLADLNAAGDRYASRYYEEALTYNHEVTYDPEPDASEVAEALNLRRLVFELVTE